VNEHVCSTSDTPNAAQSVRKKGKGQKQKVIHISCRRRHVSTPVFSKQGFLKARTELENAKNK